ncbi:MAG TPA: isoprenyl transferase [Victivallales bacterium]|nr:isoprenyl transferase [Victivallales bacterium]HRR05651.1 isoprenyl transferase [Victivallales bacterium]HRR28504.1 isoprenyl transferase [Victivallales bacterium]HRU00179.1 isoprenyl transferase [Victivallales bacterium]
MINLPSHIAIIMDGNRRWAEKRGLPTFEGHKAGAETVRKVVDCCKKYNVKNLTLYAFSTENWKRPLSEINALMQLLVDFLSKYTDEMMKNNVRLIAIGKIDKLPLLQRKILSSSLEKTKSNNGFNLILAINYGGRSEIVDATIKIARDVKDGKIELNEINEDTFRNYLYCPDIPDPDLLIRTSSEMRISNFLLWQISYTELYITDVLWPDFSEDEFYKAINDYSMRKRRFGGR